MGRLNCLERVSFGSGRLARLCGQRYETHTGSLLLIVMVNNELNVTWLEDLWTYEQRTSQTEGKYYNCTWSFGQYCTKFGVSFS